jgi:hypothetical protein
MRQRSKATLDDLRRAIECLPRHTRVAMLEGITSNPIIAGAYATGDGVCPMLAAHRAGGRTNAIAFAKAWDRVAFRGARRTRDTRARRASERELLILRSHLEASLLEDEGWTAPPTPTLMPTLKPTHIPTPSPSPSPSPARRRVGARPGDPDRSAELRERPGWAWTRIVRRYDDYESVLARLEEAHADSASEPAGVR